MSNCFHVTALAALSAVAMLASAQAQAGTRTFRWTGTEDKNAELAHIITVLNQQPGILLKQTELMKIEERDLANNHFTMWLQTAAGLPIRGMSIRTWTKLDNKDALQVEAFVEDTPPAPATFATSVGMSRDAMMDALAPAPSRERAMAAIRAAVKADDEDNQIRSVTGMDMWDAGQLVRVAKIRGRRGVHEFTVALSSGRVLRHEYREFPKQDAGNDEVAGPPKDEFSVKAKVFPIYELSEGGNILQKPIATELKYLRTQVSRSDKDPYDALRKQKYYDNKYDAFLGATEEGRKKGFWSEAYVKMQGKAILDALPKSANSFANGGVLLSGRYATVSLHPAAVTAFQGLSYKPMQGAQLRFDFKDAEVDGQPVGELLPIAGLLGQPLKDENDALNRPAVYDPTNNPVTYINQGFDEIQVYWAITTLFDSLHSMGFTDQELSTRPFNAFLYDSDIGMKDNAYYTDDTINFTTYSKNSGNMARDNPTIWHELGHGVMDRLMGDFIQLADTGGLSEGMADFVAAMVIGDVAFENPHFDGWDQFRIINHTGFNLTNEVHDDGEAYGGSMKDLLDAAMAKEGRKGLQKVVDLTLETMRLSRNHPALTANDWFGHMLFADSLGSANRAPNEMKDYITSALGGRNFAFDGKKVGEYSFKNGTQELVANSTGTRNNPLKVSIAETETATYHLKVKLTDGDVYKYKYPVTVKVEYKRGALQGAVHWLGKEQNPQMYTLQKPGDELAIDVAHSGKCDAINQPDGTCKDYAYVQIWNNGATDKPTAKKRFYVKLKTKAAE